MKTSEFIKRVEELGYVTDKDSWYVYVGNKRFTVAIVSETRVNAIDTVYQGDDVPNKLFDLLVEYAKTPLQDREEEKRYKVRCKLTNRYLDKTFNGKLDWNSMRTSQRIFTLKELEELGIDVEHYDLEEVE